MTFSICGYDPINQEWGVAVQSKFIAVGPAVTWAKANIGVIATQAFANPTFGPDGLALLEKGFTAKETLAALLKADPMREQRQVGIVDAMGNSASFTGTKCFAWAGHIEKKYFCIQGNILTNKKTIEAMENAYENTNGDLVEKLMAALHAADKPGLGDVRGKQSAALLVVKERGGYGGLDDRYIDIRVDDHLEPIKELSRIFKEYDQTLLNRENPENLIPILQLDFGKIIKKLKVLNYLSLEIKETEWLPEHEKALEDWFGINNFENRWVPGKLWKSIYEHLLSKASTPLINLKYMSDL